MDLDKRIEEISTIRKQFAEMRNLRIAADNAAKKWREALDGARKDANGNVENENDQRRITMLENAMKRAQNKLAEANTKFTEEKGKLETDLLVEVNQELSTYREKGDGLTPEEAGKRWGMSAEATTIDAQNFDNRQRVSQIEAAKAKNEERYNELDKQLKEAQAKKDIDAIRTLSEEMGKVHADIRVAESLIAQASVPYKAIEDNQAEYDALFELKSALEKMQSINPRHYNEQGFDAQINALESIAEAREENIPAEERYASLKDKKAEATKNKVNARKLIKSLTEKLAKGEIGKDYVDSVRARIEEVKGEVAAYEAQEKEYAEKMQKLEEKYNLKPEPTAMEQYEQMKAKYDQLKGMMKNKQAELDKVNEELAKDPDNAELKAKQEALKTDISKLEAGGKTCEEKLEEYKKLLGLDDKDKDKDDDKDKDKDGDKDKDKDGDKDKDKDGDKDKDKDGDKDKDKDGDKDKDKDKGDASKKVSASDYYSALGAGDKYKTKVQVWERQHNKRANMFQKAFLLLNPMKKQVVDYLEEGWVDPLYEDIKLLAKGEEPKQEEPKPAPKKEEPKKEEPKKEEPKKEEEKKSWEVDDKTKDKVKQAEQDAKTQAEIEALMAKLPEEQREAVKKAMEDSMMKGKKETKPAPEKSGEEK